MCCAAENRSRAKQWAQGFEALGWAVWRDRKIPVGAKRFRSASGVPQLQHGRGEQDDPAERPGGSRSATLPLSGLDLVIFVALAWALRRSTISLAALAVAGHAAQVATATENRTISNLLPGRRRC